MPIPRSIEVRRYYRVALQRFDEAELILSRLQLYQASIYLAGYAVECMLKALILSAMPDSQQSEVVKNVFRGAKAHHILLLYESHRALGGAAFPNPVRADLWTVSTWSVDLRYTPGEGNAREARDFLGAVKRIVRFSEQRLR